MNIELKKVIEKIDSVAGTNNSPIYNSHLYWSQKPFNICDILIESLSKKGDIVCDPFMGSGVTLLEALKLGRKPVGIEINDYPIYLLKTLLGKYDWFSFEIESREIISRIEEYQKDIYGSYCPKCNNPIIIEKTMFEYDSMGNKYLTEVFYNCRNCKTKSSKPSQYDVEQFFKYDNAKLEYFENISLIADSRIAVRENETLFDIFTPRNRKAIDMILATIQGSKFYNLYIYSLIGVIHLCKITDPKSSSQWPLWTPNKNCVEKNVFTLFLKGIQKTIDALEAAENVLPKGRKECDSFSNLDNSNYLVIKDGTQCVDENKIPTNSIDLVITDPPYMGQVIYSEYMQLYKPFLKTEIEYQKEIIVVKTKERTKTEKDFFADLGKAYIQISRMLKEGKYLCMYFHDASLRIWNQLIDIMDKAGLKLQGITHVNKGKSTLKNIVSPKKSMNGDAILFFAKEKKISEQNNDLDEEKCLSIAKSIVNRHGGKATTAQLYDNGVLEYIIDNRMLKDASKKYTDLTELFIKSLNWNEEGYWSL